MQSNCEHFYMIIAKSGLPQVHPIEINCNIYVCDLSFSHTIVTVVLPFHVSPFRYSMCRRFGYICVSPFWFVAVLTSYPRVVICRSIDL